MKSPEEVTQCLADLSKGKLTEEISSYIANIIIDDASEDFTGESLFGLIGPFLWEGKLVSSEVEGVEFCDTLAGLLRNEEPVDELIDSRMESPIRIEDLIEQYVLGTYRDKSGAGGDDEIKTSVASGGFDDPFLGLQRAQANFNAFIPIDESMKLAKALAKKREKQLNMMREWERSKVPLPPPKKRHGDSEVAKLQDILVHQFSIAVAGRELLKDAQLKLVLGRRYGLIGRNGIGKTTFLSALVRHEIPGIEPSVNIGCVEQEIPESFTTMCPLDLVLQVDERRHKLLIEEKKLQALEQNEEVGSKLAKVYQELTEIEADKAESLASQILTGLGLSAEMYKNKRLTDLSGGWRMRVMLARVLFADPDVLCLDEPTNHLDINAVAWLTNFLRQCGKTCIIVSHARDFLNDVCTDIMEFRDRTLNYYTGDYDSYERSRAEKLKVQQREFEAQQMRRAHVQKFIDKFRYNAARAALVQSRLKALAKLPMLESVTEDPSLHFSFVNPSALPTPMLVMQDVAFAWDPKDVSNGKYLLSNVDFTADLSTRAAICGVNGSGKSTFLKLLLGDEEPNQGMVYRHNKLKIGYFAQHHVDGLDLTKNAVQQLQAKYPEAKITDEAARSFLGKFGISGMLALEPLFILSGGQKSRVAIAVMAFMEPHILVLDEPTNHLDLDAVQALIAALDSFEGGVVLVSHDTHLLSCVVEDVYQISGTTHKFEKLNIEFEEYKNGLLRKIKAGVMAGM